MGVGLQMRDMDTFLADNFLKHGGTFTVYAAGKRFVFTRDILVIKRMVQSPEFSESPLTVSPSRIARLSEALTNILQ